MSQSCELLKSYELYSEKRLLMKIDHHEWNLAYLGANVAISSLVQVLHASVDLNFVDIESFDCDQDLCLSLENKSNLINIKDRVYHAKYLLFADGLESKAYDSFLENKKPAKNFQGQTLSFKVQAVDHEFYRHRSIQHLHQNATLGIISQGQGYLSVIFSAADPIISTWQDLTLQELIELTQATHLLPIDILDQRSLKQKVDDAAQRSIQSYCLQEPLTQHYGLFGLSARALHPAAAQGFNNIVYETQLFLNYCLKTRYPSKKWIALYNKQINTRYQQSSKQIDFLTNNWQKKMLKFLPLETLGKYFLAFQIR